MDDNYGELSALFPLHKKKIKKCVRPNAEIVQ